MPRVPTAASAAGAATLRAQALADMREPTRATPAAAAADSGDRMDALAPLLMPRAAAALMLQGYGHGLALGPLRAAAAGGTAADADVADDGRIAHHSARLAMELELALRMEWLHAHMSAQARERAREEEDSEIQLAIAMSRSMADHALSEVENSGDGARAGGWLAPTGHGARAANAPDDDMSYERLSALEDVRVGVPRELLEHACPELRFADAAAFRAAASVDDVSDAGDCAVCLCELEGDDGVRLLSCMHVFHTQCIDEWLQRSKLCPTCKTELC